MVLKLYGYRLSSPVQTVAIVLIEKQVPFKLIEIAVREKENKSPEYLKKHPFGQIPCIDDDGFIMYESRAICRYIATKYADRGTRLIPLDLKGYALFEQAAAVEQHQFYPPAFAASYEVMSKRNRGLIPDWAVYDEHINMLSAKLDVYDQILENQKYLAGDEITLADIFHISYGSMLAVAGSNIMQEKPNVARWYKDLTSRPSWLSVVDGIENTA